MTTKLENLLKGKLLHQTYHPKLSSQWLTPTQWSALFQDDYGDWIIGEESSMSFYTQEINQFYFLMFFTTELINNDEEYYFLMGAICQLTSPEVASLPKGVSLGESLTIKTIINFGRLTLELIDEYDITFDNQTMEKDILELSQNPIFESLNTYIEVARVQNWPQLITNKKDIGYIGHMKNYLDLRNQLEISFRKEEYL